MEGGSPSPLFTSRLEQVQPDQVAQGRVQLGIEHLQGWLLPRLPVHQACVGVCKIPSPRQPARQQLKLRSLLPTVSGVMETPNRS